MLNYLSAELYKLRRKKSLFAGMAALLALESLVFLYPAEGSGELLSFLDALLPFGFYLAPAFAAAAFDNQYGYAAVKNEVVFGIPRSRIYLGKLLAGMTAGTLAAAAAVGWYLLLWALTRHAPEPGTQALLAQLLTDAAGAWLTWLAALSFAMFLRFLLHSGAMAMAAAYLTALVGVPLGLLGTNPGPGGPALWVRLAVDLFYSAPCRSFGALAGRGGPAPDWTAVRYAAVVSPLWVGASTALGMFFFRRREIR